VVKGNESSPGLRSICWHAGIPENMRPPAFASSVPILKNNKDTTKADVKINLLMVSPPFLIFFL
jgi:hypothetical protein